MNNRFMELRFTFCLLCLYSTHKTCYEIMRLKYKQNAIELKRKNCEMHCPYKLMDVERVNRG